jgi:putative heme-binding domain-containing protein
VTAEPEKGKARFGIDKRVAWTTSRLTGTPDPPPAYRIARAFPKLMFKNPLLLSNAPGSNRLFIGEQAGKLFSFRNDQAVAKADLFLDLTTELHSWDKNGKVRGVGAVYGLTFHRQFATNRYCYVCYVLDSKTAGEQLPDGSRVSRFTVSNTDPPRCDPSSEKVLITFLAGGHNGGCLCFGPDGYLYISTGDGANPNPPDALDTGQDLSDLLSSVLRIDVDHPSKDKAYTVPADNPFLQTPSARPEIWAYGFRNPWKMSFDRQTGDLWLGDVGWELWEMIYHVKKGGNYGWSVMEGRQPVRPESRRGPTPILPPALDFPHTEAASITGGFVYRGKRHPDLVGAYLCGDWVTRKMWATRFGNEDRILSHKEIAQGTERIVAFSEDNEGEIYFVNYDDNGTLHQLVPNEELQNHRVDFPRKLSETGLFSSVAEHVPAAGVIPFSVNVEQWADHAAGERLVALPGTSSVKMYDHPILIPGGFFSGQYFFPKDGVLAKTISLELISGDSKSRRRLETQVLLFNGVTWNGYTYKWNEQQTDATLVPAAGLDETLVVKDAKSPGGERRQTWHFPSRAECITCHNPWAGYGLAFTRPQLTREHTYGTVVADQLETLVHVGILSPTKENPNEPEQASFKLSNPYDTKLDLNERARSYLHVNCSHCHQFGAGGTADLQLKYDVALDQSKTVGVRPTQGTFEIYNAHILSPGDPCRSVLYYRMAKLGRGRMPHIGSEIVDEQGLQLIHDWIHLALVRNEEHALIDKLRSLAEMKEPNAERARAALLDETIRRLLATTSGALVLMRALDEQRLPVPVRAAVLSAAAAADPQIRDLFERFLPYDQRVKRLGQQIKPETLLGLKGDVARGKELFFKSTGLQCTNCHRVAGTGSTLGPDLSQIGKKYTRGQILENILEPSKSIEPQYVTYLVETTDGQVHTGILSSKSDKEVVLKDVKDKEIRIPAAKVQTLVPQQKSLMPEQLLRDLTAAQAADLLAFLESLK